MQRMNETDIFIAGGGIAGLLAALTFGADSHNVVVADPNKIVLGDNDPLADLRTTAYLQPAQALIAELGFWSQISNWATPLQIMRLVDAGAEDGSVRETADFDASEIGDLPFGWNVANWRMRKVLSEAIAARPNITFVEGASVTSILARQTEVRITLGNGDMYPSALLIGADGRDSFVREASGISARTTRYGQKAIVFVVNHTERHQNVSTEVHRSGGPFTLVPLPDHDGKPASAVVWMDFAAECDRRIKMDEDAFAEEATERSAEVLGKLSLVTKRQAWPIISRQSDALIAERTALIAEAAHVIPPIGAQGLNMSINDILALREASQAHPLGSDEMLNDFARSRSADIALRVRGIDMLNRAAMTQSENLKALRLMGLQSLHGIGPVRRAAMELGLGAQTS